MKNWIMLSEGLGYSNNPSYYTENQVRAWAEHLGITLGTKVRGYNAIELVALPDTISKTNFGEDGDTAWLVNDNNEQIGFAIYRGAAKSKDQSYTVDPVFRNLPELRALLQ